MFIDRKIDLKAFKFLKHTRKNKTIFVALTGVICCNSFAAFKGTLYRFSPKHLSFAYPS